MGKGQTPGLQPVVEHSPSPPDAAAGAWVVVGAGAGAASSDEDELSVESESAPSLFAAPPSVHVGSPPNSAASGLAFSWSRSALENAGLPTQFPPAP